MSSENALLPRVWELERSLATAVRVNESLRQQLAAALAACKVKDEIIKEVLPFVGTGYARLREALAIQPDDSALKTWLGEPIGEVKKHTGSLKDMAIIVWSGEQPAEGTKLYSPKGLK